MPLHGVGVVLFTDVEQWSLHVRSAGPVSSVRGRFEALAAFPCLFKVRKMATAKRVLGSRHKPGRVGLRRCLLLQLPPDPVSPGALMQSLDWAPAHRSLSILVTSL
ncbi:hypothetical protein NDU88_004934, partial [Pleurodeles waltl]